MRGAARLLVATAAACAGCSSARLASSAPTPDVVAPKRVEIRDVGGAWRRDARWSARVAAAESAVSAAIGRVRDETGVEFEAGRGPLVEFDADAAPAGDVALRFVDGVRRPVLRVSPRALLSGECSVPTDVSTLVARGAMAVGAGEREPPAWVTRGVALVVADAFDLELHRRALAGATPRVRESELFGDAATDPLAAAARAKALLRCARSERPFVRFLEAHFAGKPEDFALAEVGISRRELLDAATATERARAAKAIADDPLLPALTSARSALEARDVAGADAALAEVASSLGDAARDKWLVADVRLCQAQIAMARGEIRGARTALAAASESSTIVRVRDARTVETWLAVKRGDAATAWPEFVRDFPDPTAAARRLELLGVASAAASNFAWLVDDAASLDVGKRVGAARFAAAAGANELAPLLKMLASDKDEAVRRAATPGAAAGPAASQMTGRGEFDVIRAIRASVPSGGDGVIVGIGDDCAVLRGSDDDLLLTTDLLIEGRHFLSGASARDVGWKALAVSISDVAAMGGRPRHAVLSVALRPEHTGAFADELLRGLLDCAARFDVSLVGGDTNSTDGPIVVCVTLTGRVARGGAVLRSGARPGDAVCVTGALGGSLRGRHLRPTPRVAEAAALVAGGEIHAMIDVSDGLASDLGHVLDASGVGAETWADRVPVHADAAAASSDDGRSPLDHALQDGEDFELCFVVPASRAAALVAHGLAGTPVAHVGRITASRDYLLLDRIGGDARPMNRGGHDHFRRG